MSEYGYGVGDRNQYLSEAEYRNMQGRLFEIDYNASVTDGSTEYMHITTGNKPVKILLDPSSTGAFTYTLYEDQGSMDVDSDGTAQTPQLMNRASSNTSNTSWQSNPTVNNTGNDLIEVKSGGTEGSDPEGPSTDDSVPGAVNPSVKRILDSNTEYLAEIKDRTTDSNTDTVQIIFNFWETDYNLK